MMAAYLQGPGFALTPAFGNMMGGLPGEYIKVNRSIPRFIVASCGRHGAGCYCHSSDGLMTVTGAAASSGLGTRGAQ